MRDALFKMDGSSQPLATVTSILGYCEEKKSSSKMVVNVNIACIGHTLI